MTFALIRKELGELRPWAILSLFLGLSELAGQFFDQLDMQPAESTIDLLSATNGRVYWLIAFAIGTGLVTREAEDGTLAFLDGLPLGRSRVFWVKCAVTWLLLAIGPLISLATIVGLHALSHGSLDADLRPDIVLGRFALHLGVIGSGVLIGTAIGWLRSLSWLCIGVVSTGLSVLIDRVPRAAALSPFTLLDTPLTSAPFSVPREALLVQLAIAAVAGTVGWLAFMRAGKQVSTLDLSSRPIIGAIVTVLTVGALLSALSFAKLGGDEDAGDEEEVERSPAALLASEEPQFSAGPPAETATRHYRFSYPSVNTEAALQLAVRADAIYERVHQLLSVPPSGSIDVDGSGSLENTDGTAYFGRVRISLIAADPDAVLAHETSHVIARRIAGDDRVWLWRKATLLDEGLATWVERHFQAHPDRGAGRLVLAALHQRGELILDELVEPSRLALVRDDNLKYPAGEAIIAAIIRLHGPEALPRLLRAFATPTLPMDLSGMQLWQATFQLAGIDLGKVVDELFREVANDAEARQAEIAALPRLRLRLVRSDAGTIGVQVIVEPEGASAERLLLRFKPEPDASLEDYETYGTEPDAVLWRGADQIMSGQVCAQAGLSLPPDQVLYEPWTCLPAAEAELYEP